ncbi:dTDP-4-dehydrorhamnose reductase [Nitrosomonas supralitoralis]|uniref:dTDP-4-dehydrorhamnose reductase n=1 Tax=Nitrosomonas supralitoralis TaxID=2116706 RepID=A0A2P7NWX2_9PROT|nr:dTDP-4-dehydrorhamnose reductase [Nitrosomonas supralitoralis]PSJ17977.1 dTDP-4-dehydrorhamnose reductase [Nitrosomonas supralitoralis]
MTVLIIGAAGQLGTELCLRSKVRGYDTVAVDYNELDLTNESSTQAFVAQVKPTVIINAAAYTAVDRAETEIASAFAVNRDGPLYLAKSCAKADIPLLHISTDYVFDGKKPTPYLETDTPNPQGVYGQSKLEGEIAVARTLNKYITLRTAWVFSATGNNFVRTILRLAKERDELSVVADQTGAPTWAGDIAEVLLEIVERIHQSKTITWGLYHYTGSPAITWHAFAETICQQAFELGILRKKPFIKPISSYEYPTAAKRPQNSALACALIQEEFLISQADWRKGLEQVLIQWKKNNEFST